MLATPTLRQFLLGTLPRGTSASLRRCITQLRLGATPGAIASIRSARSLPSRATRSARYSATLAAAWIGTLSSVASATTSAAIIRRTTTLAADARTGLLSSSVSPTTAWSSAATRLLVPSSTQAGSAIRCQARSQVQQIAAQLGIQGRSRMSEDELIPEILRLAPELAVKAADG